MKRFVKKCDELSLEIYLPSVIIRSSGDTSTSKDSLALDEHLLSRRKDISIGNHQVLSNVGIRDNHKELVSQPDGVQLSESLSPVVQSQFRILRQEWKGTLSKTVSQRPPGYQHHTYP